MVGRLLSLIPIAGVTVFIAICMIPHLDAGVLRTVILAAAALTAGAVLLLGRQGNASPVHKAMAAFLVLATLAVFICPGAAGRLVTQYPASGLYAALLVMAAAPLLLGREVFTAYFARRTAPASVWQTDAFAAINRNMTWFWAGIFLFSMVSGLVPGLFGLHGGVFNALFQGVIPAVVILGGGIPMNRYYPAYYQQKLGLVGANKAPPRDDEKDWLSRQKAPGICLMELTKDEGKGKDMSTERLVVSVNGSPHAGFGNTSIMTEMLRQPLSEQGYRLEQIYLSELDIQYCVGCGLCIERGKCWIDDDHKGTIARVLAADGVILASPVYFRSITAQMKTFVDRSLAFGHKPRTTWKPGLALIVSSGFGETDTAQYLASLLRVYGAYPVGVLTAIAVSPGQFFGKETVEARAHDLARDLGAAIREKRRYPATEEDLRFYQFMSNLVRSQKETMMKDDDRHWSEHGLYEGFEAYVKQALSETSQGWEMRDAWLKGVIASQNKKKIDAKPKTEKGEAIQGPRTAGNCKELLQMMPQGFNPSAARGLSSAVYQFEVSGGEEFTAHLKIDQEECTYADGPADHPDVIIKTPADIWLAISRGEMDGQQAFMSGKYKVEGDLNLLLMLGSLFPA